MPVSPQARTVLNRLYEADHAQRAAGLPSSQRTRNIDKESGRFLHLLAISLHAQVVFEIGSSNGVSTIWLASAVALTGGKVVGSEVIPDRAAEANQNLSDAGLSRFAEVLAGDARDILNAVADPIDIVFIDAEKDDYSDHFLTVIDKVRGGGVIIADNVISHDCSAYQSLLRSRADVETVTLPLDRGLEFTIKNED
jgi:predicted O-methyltransferase YrrM